MTRSTPHLYPVVLTIITLLTTACGGSSNTNTTTPASPNVAFVTSVLGSGDLSSWADAGGQTGLAAGDAICQARAQVAGFSGTFVAWLSDSSDDAYCRVQGLSGKRGNICELASLPNNAGPWVRPDGAPFADTIDLLADNHVIYTPLRIDELGASVNGAHYTTTDFDGSLTTNINRTTCTDWTDASGALQAQAGSTGATAVFWTQVFGFPCSTPARLACMQMGSGAALPPISAVGKKVFVTSGSSLTNMGGLAGGDTFCQAAANVAGLSGNYTAWLSDATTDARDRLVTDGPWVRLDGVQIAVNNADLLDGELFSAITVNELGLHTNLHTVLTGTNSDGTKAADHCLGWTSADSADFFTWGSASQADSNWSNVSTASCGPFPFPLFCFED